MANSEAPSKKQLIMAVAMAAIMSLGFVILLMQLGKYTRRPSATEATISSSTPTERSKSENKPTPVQRPPVPARFRPHEPLYAWQAYVRLEMLQPFGIAQSTDPTVHSEWTYLRVNVNSIYCYGLPANRPEIKFLGNGVAEIAIPVQDAQQLRSSFKVQVSYRNRDGRLEAVLTPNDPHLLGF